MYRCDKNYLKCPKISLTKSYCTYGFNKCPTNMEEVGFETCTAVSLGGSRDALASLLGFSHVVCLYNQKIFSLTTVIRMHNFSHSMISCPLSPSLYLQLISVVRATSSLPSIPCLGSPWPWNSPLTCVHPWTGSTRRLPKSVINLLNSHLL